MKKFFLLQFLTVVLIMGITIQPVLADNDVASSVVQGADEFISIGRKST